MLLEYGDPGRVLKAGSGGLRFKLQEENRKGPHMEPAVRGHCGHPGRTEGKVWASVLGNI